MYYLTFEMLKLWIFLSTLAVAIIIILAVTTRQFKRASEEWFQKYKDSQNTNTSLRTDLRTSNYRLERATAELKEVAKAWSRERKKEE